MNVRSMGGRKICSSYNAPFTHELCCDKKLGRDEPYRIKGFCKDCTMNQISRVCDQLTSGDANPVLFDNISQNFCRIAPRTDRMSLRNLDTRQVSVIACDRFGNNFKKTGLNVRLKFCKVIELDTESSSFSSSTASMCVALSSSSALSSTISSTASSSTMIASSSSSGEQSLTRTAQSSTTSSSAKSRLFSIDPDDNYFHILEKGREMGEWKSSSSGAFYKEISWSKARAGNIRKYDEESKTYEWADVSGVYAANRRIELKDLYPVEIQATINEQNVYAKVMSMRNYSAQTFSPTWIKVQFYDEAKNE